MVHTSEKCFTRTIYTTLVVLFSLQLVSTVERQVFDFLGYMWAPIIGNFFQLICVIIGLFGTCQFRPRFIIVYTVWSLLWLGWNIFVICLYLEVGVLNRNKEVSILTIGTKNRSWWLENGVGCRVVNGSWQSDLPLESSRPIPPEDLVQGCLLQYYYVEVIHAAVQCLLSLAGFVVSCVVVVAYAEAEEPRKYLSRSPTYLRPRQRQRMVAGYRPVGVRDSWALPTYVSYSDSSEWGGGTPREADSTTAAAAATTTPTTASPVPPQA